VKQLLDFLITSFGSAIFLESLDLEIILTSDVDLNIIYPESIKN
jgi:hypothetical protein